MKPSGLVLVLAAVLCVPATGRAASNADGGSTPTESAPQAPQTSATVAIVPPARRTGFRTLFRDLGGDVAQLPSRDSLVVAAIGGAAALAVHPIDGRFNERLRSTSIFGAGDRLGNTFALMGATFGVYSLGRATGHNRVTHVAMDLVQAQVLSEVTVQSLKVAVRRDRPDASSGYSFPSGHAAVTFATAAVLQRHHGLTWALPAYGLASYVAASRLHDNVHYISDVVMGAAVGTLAGRTVTRHGASTFAFMPVMVPGGAAFVVVRSHREA